MPKTASDRFFETLHPESRLPPRAPRDTRPNPGEELLQAIWAVQDAAPVQLGEVDEEVAMSLAGSFDEATLVTTSEQIREAVMLARRLGMDLGADTTPANFLDRLRTGLRVKLLVDAQQANEDDLDDDGQAA